MIGGTSQPRFLLFCAILVTFNVFFITRLTNKNTEPVSRTRDTGTVPLSNQTKSQVLMLSYFRSGSTFVGELLHNYPFTYYHFEPLYMLVGDDTVHNSRRLDDAVSVVQDLLECNFNNLVNLTTKHRLDWLRHYFMNNPNTWSSIANDLSTESKVDLITKMCLRNDIQLMKLNRLRLSALRTVLQNFPQLKVVYLVRDPRGIYASRKKMNFCKKSQYCYDPRYFCEDMRADFDSFKTMRDEFPGRLFVFRYEDLVANVSRYTEDLFQFLNWDYSSVSNVLDVYIDAHTNAKRIKDRTFFSTFQSNVKKKASSWKTSLSKSETARIELTCNDVIENLATLNNSHIHS